MADPADIGILITDTTLVVRSWDRWLESVTGIPAEMACGRPLAELAPGLETRGFLARLTETLETGAVQLLSPALHSYLIPCAPRRPSSRFTQMQQRVHIAPLIDGGRTEGLIVSIADATAQLDTDRDRVDPALNADDWRVRRAAVQALVRSADRDLLHSVIEALRRDHRSFNALSSALKILSMSDVGMTGPLIELLQDADPDLRIQAALALGEQQDPAAVAPLLNAVDDPDPNVRFHAIEALGRLRAAEAVDRLAAVVETDDFFLAFAAIEALALINDRRVATRLVPLLANAQLRDAVAAALGALGDDDAVRPLVDTLNTVPGAAEAVASALVKIEERDRREIGEATHLADLVRTHISADGEQYLLRAIDGAAPEQLPALARVLGWLPGHASAATLATLLEHGHVRDAAIAALVQRGERVLELVAERLSSDDAATRLAAIHTLARLGSRRATPALLPMLDGPPDIAIAAAGALARIGDPAAFEPLLDHLGHPHAAVRQAIVGALNSIGHPDMPERIATRLEHQDPLVRESAVRIAGYFGYERTTPGLVARTEDPVEAVRAAAIEHLPFVDHPRGFEIVQRALSDQSARVRAAATRALARLDHPAVHESLLRAMADPDLWVRYYAARSLGETGDRAAVAALCASAAADAAPHVRIAALDALGSIGNGAALPTLVAAAADTDEDVASAALRALGAAGGPDAIAHLKQGARADSVKLRLSAILGLAAQGGAEAAAALAWVASAEADETVTAAAMWALADIGISGREGARAAIDALLELHADPHRAEAASAATSRLGAAAAADIARGLAHPHADVRRRTVETLARLRTPDATRAIVSALDDESDAVRETAVLVLVRLGARGVEGRLQELARRDPSKAVRRAAAAAARLHSPD